jgi:large subunit ribosomal protein L22
MTFSEKRASKRIRNMLVVAKSHATLKGIDSKKMVIGTAKSILSTLCVA